MGNLDFVGLMVSFERGGEWLWAGENGAERGQKQQAGGRRCNSAPEVTA